uniref:CSON006650 protein n=1 Tax=Culicoides sonorensis TaxID=179676 RepID=A0A336MV41_CULSO
MIIFNITFDKEDKCYAPGETLFCHLHICVAEKFKARSLSIEIRGFGRTEWNVSESEMVNARMGVAANKYVGHENYFMESRYLIGDHDGNAIVIEPGTYHYDIKFTLPDILPSSFEHHLGKICYVVEAIYNIPRGFDRTSSEIFYITSDIDVSQHLELQAPIKSIKEVPIGFCCCCLSDPLQMITVIPKNVFLTGETIPITFEIDNNSNVRINYIKFELIEKLSFVATNPRVVRASDRKIVDKHYMHTIIEPYQNKLIKSEIYLDPDYFWKGFEGSVLFYCDYMIRVEIDPVGFSMNPADEMKIRIGNIPLRTDDTSVASYDDAPPEYNEIQN